MTLILLLGGAALFLVIILAAAVFLLLRSRGGDSDDAPPPEEKKKQARKLSSKQTTEFQEATPPDETNNQSASPPQPAQAPTASAGPSPQPIADSGGEQIRILIVDDNPGTRDNVTRLLYFEDDLEVIGQAVNGLQGIEMAKELKPHIVLMDINMPDMDGITATKEMSELTPFSQVVIMSVQSDQHYMKQAMSAGARDFQPKPFTSDELVSCLRRVYKIGTPMYRQYEAAEHAETMKPAVTQSSADEGAGGPIIAVYSPKGGVGSSALASNLGVALQQQMGDTVLMDGAFQFGDILVHLNTRPVRTISDLVHDGNLEVDLLPDVVLPHESGLKLLLAPTQPQLADFITEPIIKEVLKGLKRQYNAVVIDTTSQLNERTLTILDMADIILLVTVPELPSIKNAKLFLEVAEQLDFNLDKIKVLINRFNIPGGIRPEKLEQVLSLTQTYRVPYDPKLHVALNKGTSVNQHSPNAPAAQAIREIAQQISQIVPQRVPEAEAA